MQAKKEADVQAHLAEAAASYKRLLSGAVMASSESKKARTAPEPAPVAPAAPAAAPIVETTIKPREAAPAPAPAAAVASMPMCRTYMEANALIRYNTALYSSYGTHLTYKNRRATGTVQASALGRKPLRAVRDFNMTPTDVERGLHGLQHFNQPLYEQLASSESVTNVSQAMHQTASFLQSRSMW